MVNKEVYKQSLFLFLLVYIVFLLTLFSNNVYSADDFSFVPNDDYDLYVTLNQSDNFLYDLNSTYNSNSSTVVEDSSIVKYVFPDLTDHPLFFYDNDTGFVNYTPTNSEVGNFSIAVYLKNASSDAPDSGFFTFYFTILNINDYPYFVNVSPNNNSFNSSENTTLFFSINASDPDFLYGENNTVFWIVNNNTNFSESFYNNTSYTYNSNFYYNVSFCDAGLLNVTVKIEDDENFFNQTEFLINVSNVNRNVTFNGTIPNQNWTSNYSVVNYTANFSLYDYFNDSDLECNNSNKDNITFTVEGNQSIIVHIYNNNGTVIFETPPYYRGVEYIVFTASDNYSNVSSNNITLNITSPNNYNPIIFSVENQTATVNVPFELYIRVEDPDIPYGDNITYYDNTTLFDIQWYNLSENYSYGLISFTPNSSQIGNYSINISANDSQNASDSFVLNLTVQPNNPPILNTIGSQTATEEVYFSLNVSGTDSDNDPLLFYTNSSLFNLPYNNTVNAYQLNYYNDTQGFLNFTPTNEQVGIYNILFFVLDSKGANDSEIVLFEIQNVNDPPIILTPLDNEIIYVKENYTLNYNVTVSDDDLIHGDSITFYTNNTNFTINKINDTLGILTNTTNLNIGNYSLQINASDNVSSNDSKNVIVRVLPLLPPKLDNITNLTTIEDNYYYNVITATDPNNDPLTFIINDSIWSNYTTILNSTAILINTTYNNSQVGNYSINVTVIDVDNMTDTLIVNFSILQRDDPPIILGPNNLTLYEAINNINFLDVYDEENNTWNITSNLSFLNVSYYNITNAILNNTPNASQVGFYQVNFTVIQNSNNSLNSSKIINITIVDTPQKAEIINYSPNVTNDFINTSENSSLNFSITFKDDDFYFNETEKVEWYFDNNLIKTTDNITKNNLTNNSYTDNLTLKLNFCDSGIKVLKANITGKDNLSTIKNWTLNISNVNRIPLFGTKIYEKETLQNYTLNNITYNNSGLFLDTANITNTTLLNGTITSNEIRLFSSSSSRDKAKIDRMLILGNYNNSSVYYSIRFDYKLSDSYPSNFSNWTPWILANNTIDLNSSNITIGNYYQFRILINETTNNSNNSYKSIIQKSIFKYYIDNQTVTKDVQYVDFLNLNDYFYDPDDECIVKDTKYANHSSSSKLNINIQSDFSVDIFTVSTGTEIVYFTFNDSYNESKSNNITFNILDSNTQPQVQIITRTVSGGTTTQIISNSIPIEKPKAIDLIVPGVVTIYENDTISVPIYLVNTLNKTIKGITLSAKSENPNISLEFTNKFIKEIPSKKNVTANLIIKSYKTYGNYEVVVEAKVKDPSFNASNKFFINSIELGKAGEKEFNTKLAFTRDLLSSNPECLELNEQLDKAKKLMDEKKYSEANALLSEIVDSCKYLISFKEQKKSEDKKSFIKELFSNTSNETLIYASIIIFSNLILFFMFYYFFFHHKKRVKFKRKR